MKIDFIKSIDPTLTEPTTLRAPTPKFEVGEIVITPAANAALDNHGRALQEILERHQSGDWGEVPEHVRAINDRALVEHFNLQSSYPISAGDRLVVVTNRDRTLTMVHLDSRCA